MTTVPSGQFVAQHLKRRNGDDIDEGRIQPNGVDIGIGELCRTSGSVTLTTEGYDTPNRLPIDPTFDSGEHGPMFSIASGSYIVTYDVEISIPEGYVGHVYPRSRLMRSSLHLTTALWDQGYEGIGEGLLQVPSGIRRARIDTEMPIAQMTFRPADSETETYDGTHQHEGIEAGGD